MKSSFRDSGGDLLQEFWKVESLHGADGGFHRTLLTESLNGGVREPFASRIDAGITNELCDLLWIRVLPIRGQGSSGVREWVAFHEYVFLRLYNSMEEDEEISTDKWYFLLL